MGRTEPKRSYIVSDQTMGSRPASALDHFPNNAYAKAGFKEVMTSSNVKPVRRWQRQAYLRSAAATGAASASHAITSSGSIARQSIYPIARSGCVIGTLTSNGILAAASFLVGTALSKILAHRQATLPLCA